VLSHGLPLNFFLYLKQTTGWHTCCVLMGRIVSRTYRFTEPDFIDARRNKMAILEQGTRIVYTEQLFDGGGVIPRRTLFTAVRWGAIFAGVAVGISVQLALTLLGIASGLSTLDIAADNSASALGTLIWAGISMLVAAFVGGYVAARMCGLKRRSDGMLHGFVSWAVTTLLFAMLAASAGGSLLGGVFNLGQGVIQGEIRNGATLSGLLRGQIGRADAGTLLRLEQNIHAGRRDEAIQVARSAGLDQEHANSVVDEALILAGSPEQASPQARATANRAVEKAGVAAWTIFVTVALALLCGVGGGALGAVGARRVALPTGAVPATAANPV
jgi:hypothetical protein